MLRAVESYPFFDFVRAYNCIVPRLPDGLEEGHIRPMAKLFPSHEASVSGNTGIDAAPVMLRQLGIDTSSSFDVLASHFKKARPLLPIIRCYDDFGGTMMSFTNTSRPFFELLFLLL